MQIILLLKRKVKLKLQGKIKFANIFVDEVVSSTLTEPISF